MNFISLQNSLTNDEKIIHQLIAKIICAFYLSVLENPQLENKYALSDFETRAMEIEDAIYYSTGSKACTPIYKNKCRSILFNLTDEKNPDFRYDLLRGEISAVEICKMQSRDMASSAIKNFRQERQKTYTEERLILPAAEKLMVKTHKGEAVFDMDCDRPVDETTADILDLL